MASAIKATFRSLQFYNYRLWAIGALVSNIGTWMQRTAQDWLVLTELTQHNATAVGIVMSLQFGPHALLLPFSGYIADQFDRRKVLIITQSLLALLPLLLGILTLTGHIELWQVYIFAFILGCTTAIDAPVRQTFVTELVSDKDLSNAVALNSTSFNSARMIGPSLAALLIAGIGTGWVFIVNALSFVGVLFSLFHFRINELHPSTRSAKGPGALLKGFQYSWQRDDLRTIFFMLFMIGTFALNFPIFISTMAVKVFDVGVEQFGLLTTLMAVGSVAGALFSAKSEGPSMRSLVLGCGVLTVGFIISAISPSYWLFGVTLILIGVSVQTFNTSSNSLLQLTTEPSMRGRVIAIRMAIAMGCTPIGAPIVGWIADQYGPRWSLALGALSSALAALIGLYYFSKQKSALQNKDDAVKS
ncbi:MFS transporter [Vibrio aphrogenes]|uniref:MFS transporter n=1 Tax=Vibrio aphrogenes TaxID=1891186 RepID=UPI0018D533B2|nr:MFS transporter [Vibrio aphrogenes]